MAAGPRPAPPYAPAPPPTAADQNMCRATWDEFQKLQDALGQVQAELRALKDWSTQQWT